LLHALRIRFRFRLLLASTLILLLIMMWGVPHPAAVLLGLLLLVLSGMNALPSQHPMFKLLVVRGVGNLLLKSLVALEVVSFRFSNFGMALLYMVLFAALIHRLTRQRPVSPELLYGLIAIYLQIGLLFAILYDGLEVFYPGSFAHGTGVSPLQGGDFTYFSLITLTTVGYGDIYPVHPLARMLVSLEAVTGVLFIGLSMARSLMLISEDTEDELGKS